MTRRAHLGAAAAALTAPACAMVGGAPESAALKKPQGSVEFWTNAGYAYKDRAGAAIVAEFEQANPGLTIAWTDTAYGDFMSKIVTTVVAGTLPDISYADRYVTKGFACKGIPQSLDGYLKTAKHAKKGAFWPHLEYETQYNGKVYAVPHDAVLGILVYNKSMFRDSGLDPTKPPTTWEAAEEAIRRLTRRNGADLERVGWVPTRGFGVPWLVPYWQLGGVMTSPDDKKATYNNAQAERVFEWLLRINDAQGGEAALTAFYTGSNNYNIYRDGKAAMVWATYSTLRTTFETQPGLESGISYFPLPSGPGGGKRSNYVGGWALIVPNGAKNPDGAFHYLDFLSNDDAQIRWAEDWNNVPATQSAAKSAKYQQQRPERKIAVEDLPNAKFVISAPGGDAGVPIQRQPIADIFTRKLTIREALNESVRLMQEKMDEAQRACAL